MSETSHQRRVRAAAKTAGMLRLAFGNRLKLPQVSNVNCLPMGLSNVSDDTKPNILWPFLSQKRAVVFSLKTRMIAGGFPL